MKKVLAALAEMQVKMPLETIIIVLIVAFIVALIIYLTYKFTYSGVLYNPRFNVSLVMITMVTTMVMVVIGSNISVSLGMVGALSIIRFRTAVKDPRDTAFIFWCVVAGLACGTQNYLIALVGSFVLCIILFAFKRFVKHNNKYVLVIKGNGEYLQAEKIIRNHVKDSECKGKYIKDDSYELVFDVKIKQSSYNNLVTDMKKVNGIKAINLVSSNTDTMG